MKPFLKVLGWALLIGFILCLISGGGHGNFSLTINGKEVEGPVKYIAGSVAMVAAAIGGVLALAGSGILVVCALVLGGLVFFAFTAPLLLPLAVPIAIIVAIVLGCRSSNAKTTA